MRVPFPQTSCEFPFRLLEVQGKEEKGRCVEDVERGSKSKVEIDWRWINGSKPFRVSGHARPRPPFQIAKCVKGQKHSTTEMRYVIADFTTLGESHIVWPSPILLLTH